MCKTVVGALFALWLLCLPAPVRAEDPAPITRFVQLEYTRGEGAQRCPGEEMLHQEVARRVGYDPFVPGAGEPSGRLKVALARGPRGLVATYEQVGLDGKSAYVKTYAVSGTSKSACDVAISGVAVELSFDLRMRRRKVRPSEPPAPPEPPKCPLPPPPPVVEPPPPKPSTKPLGELGVFVRVARGVAPATTFGGGVHVGMEIFPFDPRPIWLSFAFEGRVDRPAAGTIQDGWVIEMQLFEAAFLACGHVDQIRREVIGLNVFACLEGLTGEALIATKDAFNVRHGAVEFAAAGVRSGLELRVHERAAFQVQGDVLPALFPVTVLIGGHREGFRSAGVWGSGSLAALLLF